MNISLSRRHFLLLSASASLATMLPEMSYAAQPDTTRVIALEWRPIEMLIACGVMPMGVADKQNYHRWVSEPALPEPVIDVGLRNEPNYELMSRMQPSLFVISSGFGVGAKELTTIAPCWETSFYDEHGHPLTLLETEILRLGTFLGTESEAQNHLEYFHRHIDKTKAALPSINKPLVIFSFLDSQRVMIFGQQSLFNDLLSRLGLHNAWDGKTNRWGSAIVGIETLVNLEGAIGLCLTHGDDDPVHSLADSALWQVMPFVRDKQLHLLPAVWFYGGSYSAMRFCDLLPEALCV